MIELTTPVPYENLHGIEMPGMPELTHMSLVAFKFEPPRVSMEKNGYCEFWVAYVYRHSGFNWEPEMPAFYLKIDDQHADWMNLATYAYQGTNISAIIKTLEMWLIDRGYIIGTWVL